MAKLQKVVISRKIIRPYGGVAEPEVGMTGHIVEDSGTPAHHTCIRFLSETLGYSYDPEYDDADRKYIKIYVPNNNFELVASKKTVKAVPQQQASSEKMKQPDIMVNTGGVWQNLHGHCCYNQKEMEEYVRALDPTGKMLKVVDLAATKDIAATNTSKQHEKLPEKLQQPQIMMNIANNWHPLPGHGCTNQKQMEEYVQLLDPSGKLLKVAEVELSAKPRKKM